jgi:basic membrane lipoprotein Med (substrate-binding protein (PBP1-ABC) superfamily)
MRFDAELALGHHEQGIGELQALVAQNPYRERFISQLMLALYRSGRHAEALDAYEKTRRRLDDDLGLQPSAELQQLSGRIVRQDPLLTHTVPSAPVEPRSRSPRAERRPAVLVAVAAAVGASLVLAAGGGAVTADRPVPDAHRLALVLPEAETEGVAAHRLGIAVETEGYLQDLETQVAHVDPRAPQEGVARLVALLRNDGVGLVVALGHGPDAQAIARVVRGVPETRFLFFDASLSELSLDGVPNAAAVRFAEEDAFLLGGYASGLMPTMDGSAGRIDRVSIVAAEPDDRTTARLVAGFTKGLRETNRGATVSVDFSHELHDPTPCEHIANTRIDEGADVVVALSGRCGLGAVEVAKYRRVWAIGAEEDGVQVVEGGPASSHVISAPNKNWPMAAGFAAKRFAEGSLPMGLDTVLGIEDDYAIGPGVGNALPEAVASAVVDRCGRLRGTRHRDI